jgi:hypothetical protein
MDTAQKPFLIKSLLHCLLLHKFSVIDFISYLEF